MARLYADENFDYQGLRRLGHDILTAQEAGRAGRKIDDALQLDFAMQNDRAVITFNRRHFVKLHKKSTAHKGIVICTFDSNLPGLIGRIDQALANQPQLDNMLLRVNKPSRP